MKRWMISAAIIFWSLVTQLAVINQPVNVYDEGFVVSNADRILRGEIPYRDFWADVYPPGQSYFLALLFKIFSPSLRIARLYDAVVRSLLAIFVFHISARLTSKLAAIFPWAYTLMLSAAIGYPLTPTFPALTLILMGIYLLVIYFDTNRPVWLVASAMALGTSATMRHDSAILGTVAAASALAWYLLPPRRLRSTSGRSTTNHPIYPAKYFAYPTYFCRQRAP